MSATFSDPRASPDSPFPGQRPFAEHEAELFFGRDAEAEVAAHSLAKSRLTLLSGPQGVGKTSLLRAGIIPRLRAMAAQLGGPPLIIVWDNWQNGQGDPLTALIDEIQLRCVEALPGFDPTRVPRVRPLERVIEYWAMRAPLFIILDQFEKYLTDYADDDGEGKFAVEFPRVIRSAELRANFLLVMRGGAHAKLGRLAQRLPQLFDHSQRLKPLTAEAAHGAIVLPIEVYNRANPELAAVTIEPVLVDQVLRSAAIQHTDLGAAPAQVDASAVQRTMRQLWDEQIGFDAAGTRPDAEVRALRAIAPSFADTDLGWQAASVEPIVDQPAPAASGDTTIVAAARTAWRSARRRRTFAALMFLFVCAYAVFGAAGWVAQLRGESKSVSVQEAADRALARARATLAEAAKRHALREQAVAKSEAAGGVDQGSAPSIKLPAAQPGTSGPQASAAAGVNGKEEGDGVSARPSETPGAAGQTVAELGDRSVLTAALSPRPAEATPKDAAEEKSADETPSPPESPPPAAIVDDGKVTPAKTGSSKQRANAAPPSAALPSAADAKSGRNVSKKAVQAQSKGDNPPRHSARVETFPLSPGSNSVIDAARAASAYSVAPVRKASELFIAQNGKRAPVRNIGGKEVDDNGDSLASPRIFIHVRDQSQLAKTMRLKRSLEASGIVVSGIKTVSRGPDDADLRYFRRAERNEARKMVDLLQSLNVPVEGPKYISGFESTASIRQYELWFPSVN